MLTRGTPPIITILICDDEVQLRTLVRRALKRASDIEVVGEASDGQASVEMAKDLRPDVVLLDIQMPVKDGLQALEEIRRDSPTSKVIMFTGLIEGVAGETSQSLGADAYIEKGSSLMDLGDRIQSLFR